MSSIPVSIVVPVYSGERYLERLLLEVEQERDRLVEAGAPVSIRELIFVDDSAQDGSPAIIDRLASERSWVVALHLSRNFGQHPATIAGILHSSGEWVATIDEDLQHPPERIVGMLAHAARCHADIVYGKATSGVHQSAIRDLGSRWSKHVIEYLSGNPAITKANSFRVIRGPIARAAASVCAYDTYFDVALSWFTQRIESLPMPLKDERFISTGKSGYRLRSLLSHGRRLIFSSQIKVLRLATIVGSAIAALSALGGLAVLFTKLLAPTYIVAAGWASLFFSICFFSGAILVLIGIVLEYLSILVLRAHGKPLFFVVDRSRDDAIADFYGPAPTPARAGNAFPEVA